MDKAKPSRTSDIPAIMRAVHQTYDDEPKILADPIVPKLVDIESLDANWLAPMLGHPFARQWRAGFLIRSREGSVPRIKEAQHQGTVRVMSACGASRALELYLGSG